MRKQQSLTAKLLDVREVGGRRGGLRTKAIVASVLVLVAFLLIAPVGASEQLTISNLTVVPDTFSPNNDLTADEALISFALNRGAAWTIRVGEAIFTGVSVGPGTVERSWDGTDGIGGPVAADGDYAVLVDATSGVESASESASVTVDNTAPVISGLQATGITDTRATITWNTNEASDSELLFGTFSGTYSHRSGPKPGLMTSHSHELPELSPNTTYFYRVTSTDRVGNETTSPELSFTTLPPGLDVAVTVKLIFDNKGGKFYRAAITVTVTDGTGAGVPGANVTLRIGNGLCPVASADATMQGTTDGEGHFMASYRTKNWWDYKCAEAIANKPGFSEGVGSKEFSFPGPGGW